MKEKLLPALGAGLWILGLVLSIVGLNIHTPTGSWISVVGNVTFLVGLGLEVIWYYQRWKNKKEEKQD